MKTPLILSLILFSLTAYCQSDKPLVVINGIAINPDTNFLDKIPSDQIESLTNYHSTEAISMYGEFLGSNGILEVKTKLTSKGLIEIPLDFHLTYGDTNPVVLLDGKLIEYAKIDEIESSRIQSMEMSRNIAYVKEWGLQAINGLIKMNSK